MSNAPSRRRIGTAAVVAGLIAAVFVALLPVMADAAQPPVASQPPATTPPPLQPAAVPTDFWMFPANATAWAAFAPSVLGAGAENDPLRPLVEAGWRGLISSSAKVDRGTSVVTALLRPSLLGAAPYRVCLMDLKLAPAGGRERPGVEPTAKVDKLAAVLEIRVPPPHDRLEAAVQSALRDDERADRASGGRIGPATIPGAVRAGTYSREGDPATRRIEWCSTSGAFIVGLGEGTLAAWVARGNARESGDWQRHRGQVLRGRPASVPVAEAFIDLNALRGAAPEEFAVGRVGKLAEAFRVANARSVMVHVRLPLPNAVTQGTPNDGGEEAEPTEASSQTPTTSATPQTETPRSMPLLAIDVSWSNRSEPPGTFSSVAISERASDVPGLLPMPSSGRFAVVLKSDWPMWLAVMGDVYAAASGKSGDEFLAARTRWLRRHGPTLERLLPPLGTPVTLMGRPAEGVGAPALVIALANGRAAKHEAEMRELMASLDARIKYSAGQRTWTMTLAKGDADRDGKLAAWSWALAAEGAAIFVDFEPSMVEVPKTKPSR
ncbi:MAG: hypothetical protein ACKVW3_16610 [Phycisphaerales bacterium]